MDYKDKNVWIIGASSGIGEALAHELAGRGARLALSARRGDTLTALATSLGTQHAHFALDVSDTHAFIETAAAVKNHFGTLDHVIMLAAIYTPSSIATLDIAEARQIVDVNLMGSINCLHAVLPHLRSQKSGQIALCGSVAAYRGLPNAQPYAATKAAVMNLTETARLEEARNGIDVRLISPGFVRTPMTDKNSFHMPLMVSPEIAAREIAAGLLLSSFEIHFPKKFTYLMKLLRLLPNALYLRMLRQ